MRIERLKIFFLAVLFWLAGAPAGYGFELDPGFIKCGTPQALKHLIGGTGKIASYRMDTLSNSVLSGEKHFLVHFDSTGYNAPDMADLDHNGLPDYIDSTLVFLEYAWDLQVNTLGYKPPLPDNGVGGGNEVDVYVSNIGATGNYGSTYPDLWTSGPSSAYFVIDNSYLKKQYPSQGMAGLKVTTMHEFFHVIQFGYMVSRSPEWWITLGSWWMEQSATWMENRGWDDVNDYLWYLGNFFNYKMLPLDTVDASYGNFMYGAVVWPMYLAKRFGDDHIRRIWETMGTSPDPGLAAMNPLIPIGLPAAFNEFAVWNYFVKDKANTRDFYPDSNLFKQNMGIDLRENFYPSHDSLFIANMTSRYAELLFVGSWKENDALNITLIPRAGISLENTLVFYTTPYDYQIRKLSQATSTLRLTRTWDRAVLVTSCPDTQAKSGYFVIDTDISTAVDSAPLYAFSVKGAVPNPFNPLTSIQFTMPGAGHADIKAYDVLGRKAAELFSGELTAGEKSILWKPSGLAGGVYFISIVTPYGSKTTKALLLK
ncbi:MAG: T9SS type A sorting domain-containing protein [Candidatus Latescibacter sp.]|nr:T9SS type A sorting domain-containing protein [Candidatus Latescibacter sp.]